MAKAAKKKKVELEAAQEAQAPEVESETLVDQEEGVELAVGPSVHVHAKLPGGFYRLGQKFTQEPTVFPPGSLSAEQIAVLQAEKMLVVKVL